MLFIAKWMELVTCMAQDPLVGRKPVSTAWNRLTNESLKAEKYGYSKENRTNCPLWLILCNDMRLHPLWKQVGLGEHTMKPNRWSIHQRRSSASCYPRFNNHPLALSSVFTNDNDKPHRTKLKALLNFHGQPWASIWIR